MKPLYAELKEKGNVTEELNFKTAGNYVDNYKIALKYRPDELKFRLSEEVKPLLDEFDGVRRSIGKLGDD